MRLLFGPLYVGANNAPDRYGAHSAYLAPRRERGDLSFGGPGADLRFDPAAEPLPALLARVTGEPPGAPVREHWGLPALGAWRMFSFDPLQHRPGPDEARDIDVLVVGTLNADVYAARARWVARLLRLPRPCGCTWPATCGAPPPRTCCSGPGSPSTTPPAAS